MSDLKQGVIDKTLSILKGWAKVAERDNVAKLEELSKEFSNRLDKIQEQVTVACKHL
jgi:hypothetical protein